MALLDKLFATKRKLDDANRESRDRGRCSKINPEQVRLLLYKECDWRGRKLLFDSSTIDRVVAAKHDKPAAKATEVPCVVEVSEGYSYVYKGPAADASVLGEMIFGAVALNHKGVSLKIHIMDQPRRLMCTKVFFVPTRRVNRIDRKASSEQPDSPEGRPSKPLNVPSRDEVALSFSFDRGDSGFYGERTSSWHSSVSSTCDLLSMLDGCDGRGSVDDFYSFHSPSARKLSASSAGSWQRRASRALATRFELGSRLTPPASDAQMYSPSSGSSTTDSSSSTAMLPRRSKLGLALLITVADNAEMDLVRRCVEHSPHLQALVCRLRLATMAAGGGRGGGGGGGGAAGGAGGFVATLHKAAGDAAGWLTDLMYGPRVQSAWLRASRPAPPPPHPRAPRAPRAPRDPRGAPNTLLADMCSVLATADTKHTNFFFSTLLTQVLTHHLGWVSTVSPYEALDPQSPQEPTKRPYNALWAQLNDLCGSIGFPPTAARTIISCQNNNQFVNKLLVVLTYFLRCGDVERTDYKFSSSDVREIDVVEVKSVCGLKRTATNVNCLSSNMTLVPEIRIPDSSDTLVPDAKRDFSASAVSLRSDENHNFLEQPMTSQLRRNPTIAVSLKSDSNSSLNSSGSEEIEQERKVLFVLGDDEKLIGLKNKSIGGKSVKKSKQEDKVTKDVHGAKDFGGVNNKIDIEISESKDCQESELVINEQGVEEKNIRNISKGDFLEINNVTMGTNDKEVCGKEGICIKTDRNIVQNVSERQEYSNVIESVCDKQAQHSEEDINLATSARADSPSKCCSQTQHSKPIKHSGFKFEFDKYPQIVTNYMKSKNLEILDRHYIGKPGNLKLDNFQFDPTIVPSIQEERCEACYKCQLMESMLQTPTNASELEFMNDMPQFAEETVQEAESPTVSPKTFVHVRKANTILVNVIKPEEEALESESDKRRVKEKLVDVKQKVMFPMLMMNCKCKEKSGFDESLLGGVTDHYVPDLVLQGTLAEPALWAGELRRDLELAASLGRAQHALAVVGDTTAWSVKLVSRAGCAGAGASSLVAAMLDALPHMWRARVPPHQCLSYLESKLRELCVLSKTLAELLMSTDFCDMETLTSALRVDVSDVPLLLAVAATHWPQVARRYGLSYR